MKPMKSLIDSRTVMASDWNGLVSTKIVVQRRRYWYIPGGEGGQVDIKARRVESGGFIR